MLKLSLLLFLSSLLVFFPLNSKAIQSPKKKQVAPNPFRNEHTSL